MRRVVWPGMGEEANKADIIKVGPKGGKIIGYYTGRDGKQHPLYGDDTTATTRTPRQGTGGPDLLGGEHQTSLVGAQTREQTVTAEIHDHAKRLEHQSASMDKFNPRTGKWPSEGSLRRYIAAVDSEVKGLKALQDRAKQHGVNVHSLGMRLLAAETGLRRAKGHLADGAYTGAGAGAKPTSDLPLFGGPQKEANPKPKPRPEDRQGDLFGGGPKGGQASLF